ncbi:MAG: purine-nucleoside phosphorylase [Polyangiales bacterium]
MTIDPAPLAQQLDLAVATLRAKAPPDFAPKVGVVLGSGLGAFAETLRDGTQIPYREVGLPASHVPGHAGNLCLGYAGLGRIPVACLQGRVHAYEGHAPDRVVFAVRALARWGCTSFVLTNAAGGVNPALEPGDLMLITDHLNLTFGTPLTGPNDETLGARFVDLTTAYDLEHRRVAHQVAHEQGMPLREGVYCGLAGPTYETPAEIRMLRLLGADAVGMSTVQEVIALRHLGVRVVAISCITNKGAGLAAGVLDHREVQVVADRTRARFVKLLSALVSRIEAP